MNQSNNNLSGAGVEAVELWDIGVTDHTLSSCMRRMHVCIARALLCTMGLTRNVNVIFALVSVNDAVAECLGCGHRCDIYNYLDHFDDIKRAYVQLWRTRRWGFYVRGVDRGIAVCSERDIAIVLPLLEYTFLQFAADYDEMYLGVV